MNIEDIGKVAQGGIRIVKNDMLDPNEVMLVVGSNAFDRLKKSDEFDKEMSAIFSGSKSKEQSK